MKIGGSVEFRFTSLKDGSPRQRQAYEALADLKLLEVLAPYNPLAVGTIPLGFDTPTSDLDIVCEVYDITAYNRMLYNTYSHHERFGLRFKEEYQAWICDFFYQGFQVQIFAQDCPSHSSPAYRHLVAQERLLIVAGNQAREAIRNLRDLGLKTQPAFAEYFALPGNPYEAVLALADAPDAGLEEVVQRAGQIRQHCPLCQLVLDSKRPIAYEDAYTRVYMDENDDGAWVIPRRHVQRFADLGEHLAGRLGRTLMRVSHMLQTASNAPNVNVWEFGGAAGSQSAHLHFRLDPRPAAGVTASRVVAGMSTHFHPEPYIRFPR